MAECASQPVREPLSCAERLLWASTVGERAVAFLECPLHMSLVVALDGRLNQAALEQALGAVVRRHRVLSSRFRRGVLGLERLVDEGAPLEITTVDLVALGDPRMLVDALLAAHIERAFDLERGPLLRALIARLAPDKHVLALVVHHIVFDAGSRAVLLRELSSHYAAAVAGRPCGLPEVGRGYASYVTWQQAHLAAPREAALLAAWNTRLDAASDVRLPADLTGTGDVCGRLRFEFEAHDVELIRRLARELRVTAAVVMLALFTRFVRQRCGTDDLVIGMPISDRRRRDFEELIGLFTNVLLVRAARGPAASFGAWVRLVWQGLLAAMAEQDLPYARFLQLRAAGAPPPFRIAFNFIHAAAEPPLDLPGLTTQRLAIGQDPPCRVDLALLVADRGATLGCEFLYPAERFSAPHMAAEARMFRTLATDVLATFDPSPLS
jgi:hypothetical protein